MGEDVRRQLGTSAMSIGGAFGILIGATFALELGAGWNAYLAAGWAIAALVWALHSGNRLLDGVVAGVTALVVGLVVMLGGTIDAGLDHGEGWTTGSSIAALLSVGVIHILERICRGRAGADGSSHRAS
jgi:hypothetical protein